MSRGNVRTRTKGKRKGDRYPVSERRSPHDGSAGRLYKVVRMRETVHKMVEGYIESHYADWEDYDDLHPVYISGEQYAAVRAGELRIAESKLFNEGGLFEREAEALALAMASSIEGEDKGPREVTDMMNFYANEAAKLDPELERAWKQY